MPEPETISGDYPFDSHHAVVHGSKMHYLDEGVGGPVLFLHGQPTWSYLWRNVIPRVSSSARCIAPDLIGMGRSDHPDIAYRFFDHVRYLEGFIEELGLRNITLVVHDWGSALGFHYAMRHQGNVKAIAFMEAILSPMPSWDWFEPEIRENFRKFRTAEIGWELLVGQNLFVEQMLPSMIVRELTEKEMNHYREPFLDPAHRKAVWRWPNEVPIEGEPADVHAAVIAYNERLQKSDLPKLLLYATPGSVMTAPMVDWCQQNLPNLESVEIGHGLHFIQEDHPHRIGCELARWYGHLEG